MKKLHPRAWFRGNYSIAAATLLRKLRAAGQSRCKMQYQRERVTKNFHFPGYAYHRTYCCMQFI